MVNSSYIHIIQFLHYCCYYLFKYFSLLGSLQKDKELYKEVPKPKPKTKSKTKTKTSDTTDIDNHELTFVNMYCSLFENLEYYESFGNCLESSELSYKIGVIKSKLHNA